MKYGLSLPNGGVCGDARTLGEFAALAEGTGWDGVFLEDYIVYQSRQGVPTYDPWIALAAIALRTERVRLGTLVTPLSRRRPWKVAAEAATIDHLSNGRLILGVGNGDPADVSFSYFAEAVDLWQRARMLDEALEVLVGLWSGQPFSYHGEYYQVRDATLLPRPIQVPGIPIWVGGAYPNQGPLRRAARWDGCCLYKATAVGSAVDSGTGLTAEDVQAIKAFVDDRRGASVPFDIMVGGNRRGANWDQERERIKSVAEAGATWWQEWIPPGEQDEMRAAIERGPLRID